MDTCLNLVIVQEAIQSRFRCGVVATVDSTFLSTLLRSILMVDMVCHGSGQVFFLYISPLPFPLLFPLFILSLSHFIFSFPLPHPSDTEEDIFIRTRDSGRRSCQSRMKSDGMLPQRIGPIKARDPPSSHHLLQFFIHRERLLHHNGPMGE